METKLTFNLLPVVSVLISVAAWYIPKFKPWYQALESAKKQLFMLGLLALTTLAVTLLSYFGFLNVYTGTTWQQWVWYPVVDFAIAMIANVSTYTATKYIFEKKK